MYFKVGDQVKHTVFDDHHGLCTVVKVEPKQKFKSVPSIPMSRSIPDPNGHYEEVTVRDSIGGFFGADDQFFILVTPTHDERVESILGEDYL